MGYWRPMGYGMHFPAHQVGGLIFLWDITGYGFSQVWVMTGSTVDQLAKVYKEDCLVTPSRYAVTRRTKNGANLERSLLAGTISDCLQQIEAHSSEISKRLRFCR